jgi:hypothetical protein
VHLLFLSEAVEFAGSPKALHESKARKHGHCRGRTSSIGADRGDDGIWINELAGSFIIITAGRSHLKKSAHHLSMSVKTVGDFGGHRQHQRRRGLQAPAIRLLVAPLPDIQDPIYNEFTVSMASRAPPLKNRPLQKDSSSRMSHPTSRRDRQHHTAVPVHVKSPNQERVPILLANSVVAVCRI